MRAVIDANVLISFLISRGETIASLFDALEKEAFIVLVSKDILDEFDEVISRMLAKALISSDNAFSIMRRLRKDTERVFITSEITASPDKKDNRYLACALDGQADYLITGDKKHLLLLKQFGKTKIVSAKEFLDLLKLKS